MEVAVSRYWTIMHSVVLSCSLFEGGMHMVFSGRVDKNLKNKKYIKKLKKPARFFPLVSLGHSDS